MAIRNQMWKREKSSRQGIYHSKPFGTGCFCRGGAEPDPSPTPPFPQAKERSKERENLVALSFACTGLHSRIGENQRRSCRPVTGGA